MLERERDRLKKERSASLHNRSRNLNRSETAQLAELVAELEAKAMQERTAVNHCNRAKRERLASLSNQTTDLNSSEVEELAKLQA